MRASFAFPSEMSPLMEGTYNIMRYPKAQYMATILFDNINWEFDATKNNAPRLVYDGKIESLDAMGSKFPHNIDKLFFSDNSGKPDIRFDYQFSEDQLAKLAKKGLWSEDGVRLQEIMTTAKFQLEVDATVTEAIDAYDKTGTPIFIVDVLHPFDNVFTERAYDVTDFISRQKPDEEKAIQKDSQQYVEVDISAQVEAAKEKLQEAQAQAAQNTYTPLTKEQQEAYVASAKVNERVQAAEEERDKIREAGKAEYEAEQARIKAMQAEQVDVSETQKDKDTVDFDDTPTKMSSADEDLRKLSGTEESTKYESNDDIFATQNEEQESQDTELPDNIAAMMERLGGAAENNTDSGNNSGDNKNDENAGGTAGTQGLGVYTFEDQDTAQAEMREDEGKGNEKSDDKQKEEEDAEEAEEREEKEKKKAEEEKKRDMVDISQKHQEQLAVDAATEHSFSTANEDTKNSISK